MAKKILLLLLLTVGMFAFSNRVLALETNGSYYMIEEEPSEKCQNVFYKRSVDSDGNVTYSKSTFYTLLESAFSIIQWAGPLLCLALSVVEFVKATASQDKDALNKAASKTVKRIVLALILFFIPVLINVGFDLIGISSGTCGIG